jgi:hypothetical protein
MPALRIEKALKASGGSFINKYRLMKDRLLGTEYEHWSVGFPEGNNHGKGHISRVLENLDHLLGDRPLQHLDPYELFLAMMSILYHDIGLLQQRKGHEKISKELLEGDNQDAYIINPIDKEIIAAAVVSHSSSRDIADECKRFSSEEPIGEYKARPRVIAALVRLSDELDEDSRRADPILQQRLKLPPESKFFWLFCQRVRAVRPDLVSKRIDINLAFEPQDTSEFGPVPGGTNRAFVAFSAEKLAKINQERAYVNQFLPTDLRYSGLHVDVKPLRKHPQWKSPRTFVFNDHTTSLMFLQSFPELLYEPANLAMQVALSLIKRGDLDQAEEGLSKLTNVIADLPASVQVRIPYDRACIHSMRAGQFAAGSDDRKSELDEAEKYLIQWFKSGQSGGFTAMGRTPGVEVDYMAHDRDLAIVRAERRQTLEKEIPKEYWPTLRGGSGCVPSGAAIDTPQGCRKVEHLRPGDEVFSLRVGSINERITTRIVAVFGGRGSHCIKLNKGWLVTSTQPVRTAARWVEAGALRTGDRVMDGSGTLILISNLEIIEGSFDVFDISTDDPCHNYIANGLLCHNKMYK